MSCLGELQSLSLVQSVVCVCVCMRVCVFEYIVSPESWDEQSK